MQSVGGDTVDLFTELLFNSQDNTFDQDTVIRTVSGEFSRVALVPSLLQVGLSIRRLSTASDAFADCFPGPRDQGTHLQTM